MAGRKPRENDLGDAEARALVACVYDELRRFAHRQLAAEAEPGTLQATALVHEAWLRLEREGRARWEGRAQFFVAAATAMRRILVERARDRARLKRGGAHGRLAWDEVQIEEASLPVDASADGLLALDRALEALHRFDGRLARIVELRVFAGMTEAEAAAVLGRSQRSVRRDYRAARLWLWRRVGKEGGAPVHAG